MMSVLSKRARASKDPRTYSLMKICSLMKKKQRTRGKYSCLQYHKLSILTHAYRLASCTQIEHIDTINV